VYGDFAEDDLRIVEPSDPEDTMKPAGGKAPAPDGKWFGEYEDEVLPSKTWIKRTYWWRSKFRELCASKVVSSTERIKP
jgi:hypothetical protein